MDKKEVNTGDKVGNLYLFFSAYAGTSGSPRSKTEHPPDNYGLRVDCHLNIELVKLQRIPGMLFKTSSQQALQSRAERSDPHKGSALPHSEATDNV